MRTWAKGSAPAAFLALGVMALGSGTAVADTDGSGSIGGGNQLSAPVTLPVDISGNSVGVLGDSAAGSKGGASVENAGGGSTGGNKTSGRNSILGGNQVDAPITAPINACGNAASLFGSADAACKGGAAVKGSPKSGGKGGKSGNVTSGEHSVLGGNQVTSGVTAPINGCGNAVAIFGDAAAGCKGGAKVVNGGGPRGAGGTTSGKSSILGGNQVTNPATVPISVCGNSGAVLGRAFSGCKGGSSVVTDHNPGHNPDPGYRPHHPGHPGHPGRPHHPGWPGHPGSTGNDTDGRFAVGSGNQIFAPITAPANLCGNAIGNASAGCHGGAKIKEGGPGVGGNRTSGRHGILSGNQVIAPVTAPTNICGNAAAVLGKAFAACKGGASVKGFGPGPGGNTTSGRHGILSGNQVIAPVAAPTNICGNAAAVLGTSHAHCKGGASVVTGGHNTGGNRTDGSYGILSGNQVIAPVAAPTNICGNAAAVLGDAAAGCLGGARVDDRGHKGHWHDQWNKKDVVKPGLLPDLSGKDVKDVKNVQDGKKGVDVKDNTDVKKGGYPTHRMTTAGAPGTRSALGAAELSSLPALPGLPGVPEKGRKSTAGGRTSLAPVDGLTSSLPVAGDVTQAAKVLPVGDLGLMSAEQPTGLTGMNSGSLVALLLGGMFAASATLFGATRRFRLGRR